MLVKPLSRFGQGRDLVGLALPDANHRNNEKNKRGEFEETTADRAAGKQVDRTEQRLRYQYCDVECDAL